MELDLYEQAKVEFAIKMFVKEVRDRAEDGSNIEIGRAFRIVVREHGIKDPTIGPVSGA